MYDVSIRVFGPFLKIVLFDIFLLICSHSLYMLIQFYGWFYVLERPSIALCLAFLLMLSFVKQKSLILMK